MSDVDVVILAAGKGTRMYSQLPKVLHELGGKPMLAHVADTALALQPRSVNVVVGHGREAVSACLGDRPVRWVVQDEQLGTGHALKMALPHLGDTGRTVVLYGDVPLIDVATLRDLLDASGDGVGVLTDTLAQPEGYGRIIRDADGGVVAIVEEKDADAAQKAVCEINTGIFVLPNARLAAWLAALQADNAQGEYYLTDVVGLARGDKVAVVPVAVRASYLASGVNNLVQLFELERIFQRNQAEALMRQGVTLRDAARFDVRGSLKCGQDVVIDVGCVFEGDCELGDGVRIGAHCVVNNAKIGAGTAVAPFSHLEDCQVGKAVQIGPFARLRPKAVLGDEVHIGNFVEVKNTTIGQGSKANHLTYLGDALIGSQTNIGAGTITCNYDGVNKHQTIIGDEVRIGSDTMLVAPVTVGDRATTGAGSVITKNCAANQLTIARAKQVTIEGWVRPEKPAKKN